MAGKAAEFGGARPPVDYRVAVAAGDVAGSTTPPAGAVGSIRPSSPEFDEFSLHVVLSNLQRKIEKACNDDANVFSKIP